MRGLFAVLATALLVGPAVPIAAASDEARVASDRQATVDEAISTVRTLVPDWTLPPAVTDPLAAGDLEATARAARLAAEWIEFADQARTKLPDIFPLERAEPAFESAESLQDLQQGAATAEDWSEAADWVSRAIEARDRDRDMLTSFGLWGVSVEPVVQDAIDAAVAGDVPLAINKSNEAIQAIEGGAGAGSLRLAGIVFFGVAVLGVLGLWVMLRRQRGPSWARSTTPHWIENGNKRGLLGLGKKKDDKDT
ncbi:MAG: hypothetical protein PVG27_05070 [Chloroflexota bacterium]